MSALDPLQRASRNDDYYGCCSTMGTMGVDFAGSPIAEELREMLSALGRRDQRELDKVKSEAQRFKSLDREVLVKMWLL